MKRGPVILLAVVFVVLPLAHALCAPSVTQSVLANGGLESTGAGYTLIGTVGQPATGVSGPSTIHEIGFWYQPGWIITEVADEPVETRNFLGRSFPNPFNPVATIEFGVRATARVNLTLYNVRGQEIRILVDRELEPGVHRAVVDGSGLASGVYFCRMTMREFTATTRLVLLK